MAAAVAGAGIECPHRLAERHGRPDHSAQPRRLRVAIDGFTAAGKTSFGHELAAAVRRLGRPTLRASLDDFKHPWRHVRRWGYDRVSGQGYYRNAYDFAATRELLLEPAGPEGSGRVVLCAHDPLTGEDHRREFVDAPSDAVLIVDSVFAFRPEYDDLWDVRIWLDIDAGVSLARGIARDTKLEGLDRATRLHRDRYHAAELLYLAEVDPKGRADIVIDNQDSPIRAYWQDRSDPAAVWPSPVGDHGRGRCRRTATPPRLGV